MSDFKGKTGNKSVADTQPYVDEDRKFVGQLVFGGIAAGIATAGLIGGAAWLASSVETTQNTSRPVSSIKLQGPNIGDIFECARVDGKQKMDLASDLSLERGNLSASLVNDVTEFRSASSGDKPLTKLHGSIAPDGKVTLDQKIGSRIDEAAVSQKAKEVLGACQEILNSKMPEFRERVTVFGEKYAVLSTNYMVDIASLKLAIDVDVRGPSVIDSARRVQENPSRTKVPDPTPAQPQWPSLSEIWNAFVGTGPK